MTRASLALALLVGAQACSKSEPAKTDGGAPVPLGSGSVAPMASASASAAPAGPREFTGTYTSAPNPLHMPEFTGTKWRGDDSGTALGDGKLSILLDPNGTVSGSIEAPLGASTFFGTFEGERISATVRGTIDEDPSWVGTMTGQIGTDKIVGEVVMSSAKGNIARRATFSATKKQ